MKHNVERDKRRSLDPLIIRSVVYNEMAHTITVVIVLRIEFGKSFLQFLEAD